MNIAPLGEVKAKFSAYIKKTEDGPIIVTKNGKPVVMMLQIRDEDDLERLLLAHSPVFQALLERADRRIAETGGLSHQEVWDEAGEDEKLGELTAAVQESDKFEGEGAQEAYLYYIEGEKR